MSLNTLWFTRCPALSASSLAIHYGWLEDEFRPDGLDVMSLLNSSDRQVRESHFAHTQANSFRHGGNIPPIWARSVGSDTRVIGMTWSESLYGLLALPQSGISGPTDLRGRRLGLPRRTADKIDFARAMYLRCYAQALATAGLSFDDVQWVDIIVDSAYLDDSAAPQRQGALWNAAQLKAFQRAEITALLRGEVDVIPSSGYWAHEHIALLGAQLVFDSRTLPERRARAASGNPLLLTVDNSLIEARPDLVVRWLRRLLEAEQWGKQHTAEVIRIAANENGVAEAFVTNSPAAIDEHLALDLSADNVLALREQKDFLLTHGFIERDFSIEEWIEPALLAEARQLLGTSAGG